MGEGEGVQAINQKIVTKKVVATIYKLCTHLLLILMGKCVTPF